MSRPLGRSDELPEQDSDSGENDESPVVYEELVVSGSDPAKLFELVEEALDEIALLVERFVIGGRCTAV